MLRRFDTAADIVAAPRRAKTFSGIVKPLLAVLAWIALMLVFQPLLYLLLWYLTSI